MARNLVFKLGREKDDHVMASVMKQNQGGTFCDLADLVMTMTILWHCDDNGIVGSPAQRSPSLVLMNM